VLTEPQSLTRFQTNVQNNSRSTISEQVGVMKDRHKTVDNSVPTNGAVLTALLAAAGVVLVLLLLAADQTGRSLFLARSAVLHPGAEKPPGHSRAVATSTRNTSVASTVPASGFLRRDSTAPAFADESDDAANDDTDIEDQSEIDPDRMAFHSLLHEIGRESLPVLKRETSAETVHHFYHHSSPREIAEIPELRQLLTRFRSTPTSDTVRIELTLWAVTPSPEAMQQAVIDATAMNVQVRRFLQLPLQNDLRVSADASVWNQPQVRRPDVTVRICRTGPAMQ
jgi:hypothetical protein